MELVPDLPPMGAWARKGREVVVAAPEDVVMVVVMVGVMAAAGWGKERWERRRERRRAAAGSGIAGMVQKEVGGEGAIGSRVARDGL